MDLGKFFLVGILFSLFVASGVFAASDVDFEDISENNFLLYVFMGGGIILLIVTIVIVISVKKEKEKEPVSLKTVVFGKINRKFIVILGIILLEIILVGFLIAYYQNQLLDRQFSNAMLETEENFADLKEGTVSLLSATLQAVSNDEVMRQIYLEKDREKLFEYAQPLFQELKNRYKITHLYFIEPDGIAFIRLHNKDIFGDKIERSTFLKAKETNLVSSGIELGETAYALRVVAPYYDGETLIGYIELDQEVDEFFNTMKKRKGDEFSMIVEKNSLNKEDWSRVREVQGLRNNWEDSDEYVVVSSTIDKAFPCSSYDNVELLRKRTSFLEISKLDDREFACGGFSLIDISTEKPGVVFSLINATEERAIMFNMIAIIMVILAIVFSIFVFIGFYVSRNISKPLAELNIAAEQLQKKNFKVKVDIHTGDELQILGNTLNSTAEALDRMDVEHKQLEKAKTEFLSITSHELRSPMTPMRAQLQMLLGEYYGKLTDDQKSAIEIVSRNTKRLDGIIIDFLEISRIEAARLKFRFVKSNPEKVVSQVVDEMKGFLPEKEIKVISKIEKLPIIEHDPDRLSQILRNLVNNAIKFSKKGGAVGVRARLEKGMILFSVTDQGIGLDEKAQQRLFEPFFQAEQTIYREHQGTGLGLAIVKGIVESQGGKVWLESVVGKGATFYFTLPLKPVKEIKPIKLLFSAQKNNEDKIKDLFVEMLGPMGNNEFKFLKKKNEFVEKDLILYVEFLAKKGILDEEKGEVFKVLISAIFGSKENEG